VPDLLRGFQARMMAAHRRLLTGGPHQSPFSFERAVSPFGDRLLHWTNERLEITLRLPGPHRVEALLTISQRMRGEWVTIATAACGAGQTVLEILATYAILPNTLTYRYNEGYDDGWRAGRASERERQAGL
jgi:hypothetical protein